MIKRTYRFIKNGKANDVYTLTNKNGCEADVLTYGARIIKIWMPDRNGKFADLAVGCADPEDYYASDDFYFGATVGRYANRIRNAEFTLNGKKYALEKNDGKNCLHGGGTATFAHEIWAAEIDGDSLVMRLVSKDGAGGFPGELRAETRFTLTDGNELKIEYKAISDKDTVCSLTNHTYFNLGGREDVLDHELTIKAYKMTEAEDGLVPLGNFRKTADTPYGFYPVKKIGRDINCSDELIRRYNGYDCNYCIARETARDLEYFATVYDEISGRKMDCYTTMPGVQLFTANSLGGFKGKKTYKNHCALCLETQFYPNSPNCPNYPSATLKAGEEYRHTTVYAFSVK